MKKDLMLVRGFIRYILPDGGTAAIVSISAVASHGNGSGDAIAAVKNEVAKNARKLEQFTGFLPLEPHGEWSEIMINSMEL